MLSNQAEIELVNLLRRGERTVVESNDHLPRLGLTNLKMVQSRGKINQLYSKQKNERRFQHSFTKSVFFSFGWVYHTWKNISETIRGSISWQSITDYLESGLTHKNHSSMNSFWSLSILRSLEDHCSAGRLKVVCSSGKNLTKLNLKLRHIEIRW